MTKQNISLQTLLEQEQEESIFVKLDIEGFEVNVIHHAKKVLSNWKYPLTLTCCTYHRETDCETIQKFFDETGFISELSNGYMLTNMNDENGIYTLRHGVIRASNIKQ